jgi:uncharacterized protein YndB with AHSA1/START domain
MPDIRHEVLIAASAQQVFEAFTWAEKLSAWWTNAQAKEEVGTTARFQFGPNYSKEMRIDRLVWTREVLWTCIAGAEELVGTTLLFTLERFSSVALAESNPELADQIEQQGPLATATVLLLNHDGWRADTSMLAECNYTWGRFLRGLKLLCEMGTGLPWPHQHQLKQS